MKWTKIYKMDNANVLYQDNVDGVVFDDDGNVVRIYNALESHSETGVVKTIDGRLVLDHAVLNNSETICAETLIGFDANQRNYYHWWAETLLGINFAKNILRLTAQILMPAPEDKLTAWQRASLQLVCGESPVVYPSNSDSAVVRIQRAFWMSYYDVSHTPGFLYRHLASHVFNQFQSDEDKETIVFIERKYTRQVENLEEIERALAPLSAEIVLLEDMDQLDQIRTFRRAKLVIGVHGAGLVNMLFCRPGTRILELVPSAEVRDFFWMLAAKMGHIYGTILCQSSGTGINSSVVVDPEKLLRAIHGILGT